MLKPVLAGAFLALFASGALAAEAQQVPPPPQSPQVVPGTGGTAKRGTGPAVLGLQPGEVRVSQVRNARVMSTDGLELGTAADMLLDRQRNAVNLLGLQTTRAPGKSVVVIPWSEMRPARKPEAGYITPLTPQAIANAPSFRQAAQAHPDYVDVERNLLGRSVKSTGGQDLGTVVDLVVQLKSGAINYVLIDTGFGLGTGNKAQAVPWRAVARLPKQQDQAMVLRLDQQQLAQAPFFGLKARERPAALNPQRLFEQVPPTGSTQQPQGMGTVVK